MYDARVTLAQRLLLAIGVLTVVTTVALGFGVREAWRRTEEERFRSQFQRTSASLEQELSSQVRALPALVRPLCLHDPVVDSAVVDLEAGRLDSGRRLALSLRVPELMRAFDLDELVLATGRGEILGAGHADGLVGKRDPAVAALLAGPDMERANLRTDPSPLALVAYCRRGTGRARVGLVAARHLGPLLERVSTGDVKLSLVSASSNDEQLVEAFHLPELGTSPVFAVQSRIPLHLALQKLDATVLALGGITFVAALGLALFVSRGLARPIVLLSRQAREVIHGEPKPVEGGGGRELRELAAAFNQAIMDLAAMRKRLAATERIAARREIARRVAHEIKNPLAPIRAAVETLRRLRARQDPAFDEYFDEATRTVLDEVARISNIVSEFTRFARLPPPNPAPMDLVDAVRKVVAFYSNSRPQIELFAEPLPLVTADRDQLVQVMTNLVQNAIDACEGVAEPRVRVSVMPLPGERVELRVSDNGPGVTLEMRERLFEPYATSKEKGTGLGLAIVHRIVVEHGGEIQHRDAPGGGAEFEIVLPTAGPTLLPEAPPMSH